MGSETALDLGTVMVDDIEVRVTAYVTISFTMTELPVGTRGKFMDDAMPIFVRRLRGLLAKLDGVGRFTD